MLRNDTQKSAGELFEYRVFIYREDHLESVAYGQDDQGRIEALGQLRPNVFYTTAKLDGIDLKEVPLTALSGGPLDIRRGTVAG